MIIEFYFMFNLNFITEFMVLIDMALFGKNVAQLPKRFG